MCLGIPGQVKELYDGDGDFRFAKVDFGGVAREVCMSCVPDAEVGDYVIVHVGFALNKIDADEAQRVFDYLDEIGELSELDAEPEEAVTSQSGEPDS